MEKSIHEVHIKGIKISDGIAFSKACLFNDDRHKNVSVHKVNGAEKKNEKKRLQRAIDLAAIQLGKLINDVESRIGVAESKIFVAQKLILEDVTVIEEMFEEIDSASSNAEGAVIRILEAYEARLLEVDDEYIKARATDIGEIRRRILDMLSEVKPALQCIGQPNCEHGKDRIIVARELTPTLTVSLDTKNAAGFVTEHGGMLSHAAILAKSLGIPVVSGINNILDLVFCGTEVLIDGFTGEIYIWPSEQTKKKFRIKQTTAVKKIQAEDPVPEIRIFANINLAQDVDEAIAYKAEGVGLYRTEFEFLAQGRLLSEDEQFERYAKVVKAMNGKPVYFRLLDIGGDKASAFFNLPIEANPYLGFRGSRLLLARPELLQPQVRALARASAYGPVYILYPMIVDLKQFETLKNLVCQSISDIDYGEIRHGVMFEVPSACLDAERILSVADFASIGSNDLIQYLFAVDRNNEHVAYDYSPEREIFWTLVKSIVQASEKLSKPLSICGEIAGSIQYMNKLMEIGVKCISVSARLISDLRLHFIREA
jgi:phosphotransferase system enzyme I (PtsI)